MPLPVLSVAQMRAWEAASWAAGVRETEVIARVGRCVARRLGQLTQPGAPVLLLAGRGHNGDDARAALPHLAGREARLLNAFIPAQALADLRLILSREPRPAWIVDGLFGTGLDRELSADWRELITAVNKSGVPVLALDTPSGLDADTGCPRGAAIRAAITLAVGAPKRGLLVPSALAWVGRLEVAEPVGLLPRPESLPGIKSRGQRAEDGGPLLDHWTQAEDFAGFPPARPLASHKGDFGHLVILAGSLGYHGAAVLAARGAAGARPGLVTVITSPQTYQPVAAQLACAMVRNWDEPIRLPPRASALLVGPGLAAAEVPAWLRAQVVAWWRAWPGPMIADANALDWLAGDQCRSADAGNSGAAEPLEPEHGGGHPEAVRVITPHPGEAARMAGPRMQPESSRRELGALASAAAGGCWTVLKGYQTWIGRGVAEPGYLNSTGNSGLAQGGSGDVLAGFMGGLLAQPTLARDPLRTIRYAVWEHGGAADRLEARRRNWTAEDLAAALGGNWVE